MVLEPDTQGEAGSSTSGCVHVKVAWSVLVLSCAAVHLNGTPLLICFTVVHFNAVDLLCGTLISTWGALSRNCTLTCCTYWRWRQFFVIANPFFVCYFFFYYYSFHGKLRADCKDGHDGKNNAFTQMNAKWMILKYKMIRCEKIKLLTLEFFCHKNWGKPINKNVLTGHSEDLGYGEVYLLKIHCIHSRKYAKMHLAHQYIKYLGQKCAIWDTP